jgi:hypothetical protein
LDNNTHPLVVKDHDIFVTDEIESSMDICVSLWNIQGIGLYDQHILFENPNQQWSEISKVLSESDQLDEKLEDILDMIDLETAIRFLREDVKNSAEVSENETTLEIPTSIMGLPGIAFLDLKKESISEGTGWPSPAICVSTLRVDYSLVLSPNYNGLKALHKIAPLVISLISPPDFQQKVSPLTDANRFVIQGETTRFVSDQLCTAVMSKGPRSTTPTW